MDFPSGLWTGFYNYGNSAKKHRMDLVLTFANRTISGDGRDNVGLVFVSSRFDDTNGECYWTKNYVGVHDVYHRGFHESKGISGVWQLRTDLGGFHIWPLGEDEGEHEQEMLEEPAPVEAVAAQTA